MPVRKLVFVVESSDRDCRVAKELIEGFGYEVIALADVEAAVAILPYMRADLIITAFPLAIPEDGQRQFATHAKRESPRTLVLGSVTSASDARSAIVSGCDAFVAKPLDPEVLRSHLRHLIGPAQGIAPDA